MIQYSFDKAALYSMHRKRTKTLYLIIKNRHEMTPGEGFKWYFTFIESLSNIHIHLGET